MTFSANADPTNYHSVASCISNCFILWNQSRFFLIYDYIHIMTILTLVLEYTDLAVCMCICVDT